MTIRFPRLGLLFILALMLALGVMLFLSQQEQRLALGGWPRYAADAVQSIEIVTQKERYALVREGSGWVVRTEAAEADALPVQADALRVETLLAAIGHNPPTQSLGQVPAADLPGLGLDAPQVRILLRPASTGQREALLTLGRETPAGAGIYAQSSLAPDTVFLLDASVLHQFAKPAEHYFDYRLMDVRSEDVQRLSLSGSSSIQWELERKDENFVFLRPEPLAGTVVSFSEVRLYLHNLTALSADSILTRAEQQPAAKPYFSIEIHVAKAAAPVRLEVMPLGEAEQILGRSSLHPAGFLLEREKAKALFRQAFDMQWRGVVNVDSAKVERVRVYAVAGNQTFTAEKTEAGWEDRERGLKVPGIDMTLWRLKELRFEAEPVARLAYPAVQRVILDFFGKDSKVLSTYTFFTDPRLPADQCWLKVGAEEMYYPVSNQIVEELQGYLPQRPARTP